MKANSKTAFRGLELSIHLMFPLFFPLKLPLDARKLHLKVTGWS